MQSVGKNVLRAVRETVGGFTGDDARMKKMGQISIEGDLTKADDDANPRKSFNLVGEMGSAVANLLRRGFVARRGAADDRGDPGVAEFEAVVARDAGGLAGKPQLVQDGVHEVAGAIASEWTTGAVGPVGSGGKAQDKNPGTRVAKAGNRTGPVGLVLIGAASGFANATTVVAQARTAFAIDDGFVDLLEERRERLNFGAGHCIP